MNIEHIMLHEISQWQRVRDGMILLVGGTENCQVLRSSVERWSAGAREERRLPGNKSSQSRASQLRDVLCYIVPLIANTVCCAYEFVKTVGLRLSVPKVNNLS